MGRSKFGSRAHSGARKRSHADPKPFVGDELSPNVGKGDKALIALALVLLSAVVGFVIGFAVFLVMNLSTWLTDLLWVGVGGRLGQWWFPLVTCTLGGVAIGVWTHLTQDRVSSLEEVMAEFRHTGSYRVHGVVRPVVSFLLPLVFGGSIGFEAGLTGLIAAGCCWIRDQLKKAGLRAAAVSDVTIAASLAAIFGTPLAGIVAGVESDPKGDGHDMRRGAKVLLYSAAAFGAFAGLRVFSAVFGASDGFPRFDEIASRPQDVVWAIPCLVVAYAMALVFHGSRHVFGRLAHRLGTDAMGTIAKPVICGVAMGAIACVLPLVLFPGEAQCEELMEGWVAMSALVLLLTGVFKAVVTPLCLSMGWMGGDLFPSICAGVAAGYGLAALTGAEPMLMVTVTTAAYVSGVIRKPLLVLAILFLCFPADGIIWMGLAAVLGSSLPLPRAWLTTSS